MYRRISPSLSHSDYVGSSAPKTVQTRVTEVQKRISGRYADIWLSFSIITIPPLAFSALLLGLVYSYRVTHATAASPNLRTPDMLDESGVYYVKLSATVLIFIASWSSSLAPLLVGFVMNLASYPISRQFWNDIKHQRPDLPTPYQFALVLKFIVSGGWGALYNWIQYLVGWKKQRQLQSKILTASASVTFIASILGFIVFVADTWLHITTSTINFVQINSNISTKDYSLTLRPRCLTSNNSFAAADSGCNLNLAGTGTYLIDAAQSLRTVNNISDTIAVLNNGPDPTYTYLGIPASASSVGVDFTATTFGMRTECKPISTECNLYARAGAFTPYWCTETFNGDLTQTLNGWAASYFTDQTMLSNETGVGVLNPYYYGLAALFNNLGLSALIPMNDTTIPEIVNPIHGGVAFVLLCSITTYDVEYDSINETVTRFVTNPSNSSVVNVWQAPMALVDIALRNLQIAALIAASIATDAQDLADQIALAYSRIALGIGAQSVQSAPALAMQERTSILVTRIPVAPLFSLIAANLAFVLLGVILTGIALGTSGGEVREIQARLSIVGLVADRFEGNRAAGPVEGMEALFEEHEGITSSRVVIDRSMTGGYMYKQWLSNH